MDECGMNQLLIFVLYTVNDKLEGELRHVVQIDVAVFRKGESKTL